MQTLILFGVVFALGAALSQDADVSPDASSLFQSTTANGRPPQCQLLRREPRSPSAFFTNILTKPENTSTRFAQTSAALGRDTRSMAAMISLLVDDRSLPTTRSYVNVLLTNAGGDQFWLSQNIRTTTPFLKAIVNNVKALSVNTVQLNLMLPMTGLQYWTGPQTTTAFLPAGDYVVEVQLVRAATKNKGGGAARNGRWQKLPALSAGSALDQATLRGGDNVVGCARLDSLFSVSPIDVSHIVTDSMPLILSPEETMWYAGRQNTYDEPLFTPKPMFLVVTGAASLFTAEPFDGFHTVTYQNATLLPLARYSDGSGSCTLNMDNATTVPLLVLSPSVAMVTLPSLDVGCGSVQFRLLYVFPDGRRRIVGEVFATTPVAFDGALDLAIAMNNGANETDRLIAGLATVLAETDSTLPPRYLDDEANGGEGVDTVRDAALAVTETATMATLRSLWTGRVDAWNVTQLLASALVEVRTTLAQVTPFASEGASNSSSFIYQEPSTDTDDFFEADDDYFSHNVSGAKRSPTNAAPSPLLTLPGVPDMGDDARICSMGVAVDAIDALSTAFVKLQRLMAVVRTTLVQVQRTRQRGLDVTVADLVTQLSNDIVTDDLLVPLIRLYTQVTVLGVLEKNVERLTLHLNAIRDSGCLVPCLHNVAATYTAAVTSCDSYIEVPLKKELDPFSIHEHSCVAEWYPEAVQMLNAFANGSAMISTDNVQSLLPTTATTTGWSFTLQSLLVLHKRWPNTWTAPLRGDVVTRILSLSTYDQQVCTPASADGGRTLSIFCQCGYLMFYDDSQPLQLQVEYFASRQLEPWQQRQAAIQLQLPIRKTPAIVRPPSVYLYNDTAIPLPIMGLYYRSPAAGFEDAYEHENHEYRLILRRGRASCPKGEWGVVPAFSQWKKLADPARPWNNATDTVVAQFTECFFHTDEEKRAFSVAQSYNGTLMTNTEGYRLWFSDP